MNEPAPDRLRLLEAGAHNGRVAADILDWFKSRKPQWFDKLDYWIWEPSPRRQRWQKKTLDPFKGQVLWFDSWEKLPPTGVRGIIFSNELLDAMPVHRLGWDAQTKHFFEWCVGFGNGRFTWEKMDLATPPRLQGRLLSSAALREPLSEGLTIEISPAAEEWWI